jgi:hypothetical protein
LFYLAALSVVWLRKAAVTVSVPAEAEVRL